jgi:hypothetical protein
LILLLVRDSKQNGNLINHAQSGNVDSYYFVAGQTRERDDALNNKSYGIINNEGNQKLENSQITEI